MKSAINKIGFWSGLIAFAATISFCVVQVMQLYGLLTYPGDEILIYGTSLCIVIPFLVEMLALHYTTPENKRFWSHTALTFSIMYAVFVSANYVVQLATVIPMTLEGRLDEIRILQQTPHSMFWNFDAMGYVFMGFATLAAVPIFHTKGFEKWVRRVLLANALITPLIGIVYFYPRYSSTLLLIALPWMITAPLSMLLIAINFRKNSKMDNSSLD